MTDSAVEIQGQLTTAAIELDAGSTKLARLVKEFEGHARCDECDGRGFIEQDAGASIPERVGCPACDGSGVGEYHPGAAMQYKIAIENRLIAIYDKAIEDEVRPPAEDIRRAKAEAGVRNDEPALWADYHRLATEIKALQIWISARKQSISARQSVLKGERG